MYELRHAQNKDYQVVFDMINERIEWMNKQGLHLWNETNYVTYFPMTYYQEQQDLKQLYVLVQDDDIIAAVVLLEEDPLWEAEGEAYYIHNLVSRINAHISPLFFELMIEMARKHHKDYLRLDSAENSEFLTRFYTNLGFVPKGVCQLGVYHGILRELKL